MYGILRLFRIFFVSLPRMNSEVFSMTRAMPDAGISMNRTVRILPENVQ